MSDDRCFCGAAWSDVAEECEEGHAFGEAEKLRAELAKVRDALARLSTAAYDVVQVNRSVLMSGTEYKTPRIKALAMAMFEANKVIASLDAQGETTNDEGKK